MENKTILTKEGKKKLQDELKHLLEVERPKVIAEIAEARAQGDLSENAEFDSAREKQGEIEGRIGEITAILEDTSIVTAPKNNSKVNVGSVIYFSDLEDGDVNGVSIVGSLETDPEKSKISNISPLGDALVGSTLGEVKVVMVDSKYKIQILGIDGEWDLTLIDKNKSELEKWYRNEAKNRWVWAVDNAFGSLTAEKDQEPLNKFKVLIGGKSNVHSLNAKLIEYFDKNLEYLIEGIKDVLAKVPSGVQRINLKSVITKDDKTKKEVKINLHEQMNESFKNFWIDIFKMFKEDGSVASIESIGLKFDETLKLFIDEYVNGLEALASK